jgi:hypothetical protein
MKRISMIVFLIVVGVAASAFAWYHHITAVKTTFAPQFSKNQFVAVPYGTTLEATRKRLGAPLAVRTEMQAETWEYGRSFGEDAVPLESRIFRSTDMVSMEGPPVVVFDGQGRVSRTVGLTDRTIAAGTSKEEVEGLLGRPIAIRLPVRLTEYQYARPACADCNYEDIRVWFDERNRLVAKRAVIVWD